MSVSILNRIFTRSFSNQTVIDKIKLTLYTKKECSLCDDAKEIIEENYPNKFEIEGYELLSYAKD